MQKQNGRTSRPVQLGRIRERVVLAEEPTTPSWGLESIVYKDFKHARPMMGFYGVGLGLFVSIDYGPRIISVLAAIRGSV